jgi:hypothetical protein
MPTRKIQNYLSSGEATEIKVGGTADENKVVTKQDIIDVVTKPAYCAYSKSSELSLTNSFQVVKGWSELITPLNISYNDITGNFKALEEGVYEWTLERIYTNSDINPVAPIQLSLQVIINDSILAFSRTAIIGAATANDEPNVISFTSPFIYEVAKDTEFNFQVKASEGANTPESTKLVTMQLKAIKIHNIL